MASPYGNRNFRFHGSWFLILVLYFWSPCDSRAHVAEIKSLLISDFSIALLFPCGIRTHATKQVASPCENRNFRFHGSRFPFSVLHFWSPCCSRAHAAKAEIKIPFVFLILALHYCSHAASEHMQWNKWPLPAKIEIYDFRFSDFKFLISVLFFWSPCCSRAHAVECGNWNFFRFQISALHCCSPSGCKAHVTKHVASPYTFIVDFGFYFYGIKIMLICYKCIDLLHTSNILLVIDIEYKYKYKFNNY